MYDDLVKGLREAHEYAMEWGTNPFRYSAYYAKAADVIEELDGLLYEAERDRDEYRERLDKTNDAIEELSKLADAIPHVCECCIGCEVESGGCDNAFVLSPKRAREYLSKPRWVSVTERLPEGKGYYLCILKYFSGNGHFTDVCRYDGSYFFQDEIATERVTHWMKLPEMPKEDE